MYKRSKRIEKLLLSFLILFLFLIPLSTSLANAEEVPTETTTETTTQTADELNYNNFDDLQFMIDGNANIFFESFVDWDDLFDFEIDNESFKDKVYGFGTVGTLIFERIPPALNSCIVLFLVLFTFNLLFRTFKGS